MPRVATCKDCGARFKVPDSTTATRAKCKTCGGVLEIPPADGAAPAAKAPGKAGRKAAPAAKAAPKKAASARPAPAKKTAASKRSASKVSASSGGAARSGGARKGARKASGGGRKAAARGGSGSDSKTGLIVGIVVVVLIAGVGGWWFFGRDDATTTTPDTTSTTTAADIAAAGAEDAVAPPSFDKAPAPANADTTSGDDDAGNDSGASSGNDTSGEPALAKAPAPAPPAAAVDPDAPIEPLPTLIEFEPLEPALGSTAEELAEWTALITETYVEFGGATGKRRGKLLGQVRELDPVLSVPAYLNALNGVDIGEPTYVIAMYKMVDDWQKSVGYKPTFSFPADTTRMDASTQNLRVKVLNGWRGWWVDQRKAGQDQEKLDEYRLMVETALREKPSDSDDEG